MNAPVHDPFTQRQDDSCHWCVFRPWTADCNHLCPARSSPHHHGTRRKETRRDLHPVEEGADHVQMSADLTSSVDRERLATIASSVNGLVHCAGQQKHCPIRQLSEQAMTDMYAINFLAPVMLTQRLLQTGALEPSGSIIFLLSTAAHIGTRGVGPYSAMKAGLTGIIRCLALEQAKRKIRVNGISPSAVVTPMWGADQLEAQKIRHP